MYSDYLSKLFQLSEEFEGIEMRFKEENIENFFRKENIQKELYKSKLFCFFSNIGYFMTVLITLYVNDFNKPAIALYEKLGFIKRNEFQTIFF